MDQFYLNMINGFYKEKSVVVVNKFCYFGVNFNFNGKFKVHWSIVTAKYNYCINEIKKVFISGRINRFGHMNLFRSLLESTFLYGSEIWGFDENVNLETVHMRFIKQIYSLVRWTPHCVLYMECDRVRLIINVLKRILKWKTTIDEIDKNRLLKICFHYAMDKDC